MARACKLLPDLFDACVPNPEALGAELIRIGTVLRL